MAPESLPTGWQLAKLGELGEVNRGRSRHRPRYAEHLYGGPYPFVQTGDIKNSGGRITTFQQTYSEAGLAQSRMWPKGTMCITIAANIAETAILGFPACFPDSVVGFIADETKCDVNFIEYTFRYLKQKIQHEASGSVQDNINLATLERLRFPIPPLPEQRAIARILGTLDEKIELNRGINATLEAIARALFKSWFVDFDPARAKAEGRDLGLPKHLADLFPNRLVDSELGEIPEGWPARLLGEVLEESNERVGSVEAPEYSSTNEGLQLRADRFTKKLAHSSANNKLIRKGYMVFGLSRRVLNFGLMRREIGSVSAAYKVFAVDDSAIEPDLLERVMRIRSNYFYNAVSAGSREGQSIASDALGLLRFVQPSAAAQRAYYRVTAGRQPRLAALQAESGILAALRDTLLPKLISGELRVKDTEQLLSKMLLKSSGVRP